jgi:hypothetical protein
MVENDLDVSDDIEMLPMVRISQQQQGLTPL